MPVSPILVQCVSKACYAVHAAAQGPRQSAAAAAAADSAVPVSSLCHTTENAVCPEAGKIIIQSEILPGSARLGHSNLPGPWPLLGMRCFPWGFVGDHMWDRGSRQQGRCF